MRRYVRDLPLLARRGSAAPLARVGGASALPLDPRAARRAAAGHPRWALGDHQLGASSRWTASLAAEQRVAETEAEAEVARANARASAAEADARTAKAKADTRVVMAEADVRVAKAEARAVKALAEAEVRVVKAEATVERRKLERMVDVKERELGESQFEVLGLRGERHLRGAVELIADDAAKQLRWRSGVRVDGGGRLAWLNAAMQHDPKLRAVVRLLAERHHERPEAVEESMRTLYDSLSALIHATGNEIVVRELDFPAGALRCGVCALLEWRHLPYKYYNASGFELPESPYKLSFEDREAVAVMTRGD